jgi:hypothetical protein
MVWSNGVQSTPGRQGQYDMLKQQGINVIGILKVDLMINYYALNGLTSATCSTSTPASKPMRGSRGSSRFYHDAA